MKSEERANRPLWFASSQSLTYLHGSLPGDYGFDPLGLSDPEGTGGFIEPRWLAYGEIINGRFAMLGAAGAIAPEILGKAGLIPAETALPWFQTGVIPPTGTYSYWIDNYTLFVLEMALMGFTEHRRLQGLVTGVGPYQNLLDHLADPVNNNVLTSLKFH
ncbi:hypothetical protein AXX17_AT3G34070 [Arabidopsis thaliana]|uniref:Chlorophyll a-b binding protein, chloroplastic n=1 Tax=Arabidopsis thaliana TaxID=3702 RepID=A0A178V669_ARATH|nr:hypothetical protein AXX17_AT3G34070 [Arabidopsis thaliana]